MTSTLRIDVADIDGVQVIRFHDRHLFDDKTVREVSEQIEATLPDDGTPIRLVLNFTGVALISSSFLSKLLRLKRRIDASHGKLRLCEMSDNLQLAFRSSNLDRLFQIARAEPAALSSF